MKHHTQRLRVLHQQLLVRPAPCASRDDGEDVRRPLAGIRVVELATVMAAPVCGTLLADYGAEVIKIEDPKAPDVTRSWGRGDDPARTADPRLHATVEGGGSSFVQLNRGKKSIAINPTTTEGKEPLMKLLATADIFITNVRLKSLKKASLDYETLAPRFPKLIYGHLSAFGLAGPMVDDPGYDFGAFWAQSGLMDITKASEDAPPPREPGGIGDYNTGMQLLGGIFAALYDRTQTGKGQLVDASLMRAGVWSMAQPLVSLMGANSYATGVEWQDGSPAKGAPLRGPSVIGERVQFTTKCPFKLKCGTWIQLLGNDVGKSLEKTRAALGVSAEALWGKNLRNIDWAASNRVADAIFAQKTLEEWEPILKEHDVWYKLIHRFEDQRDPNSPAYIQSKAVGVFTEGDGVPGISRHDLFVSPVKLSDAPAVPRAAAPQFGEHTHEVLGELGYAEQDIAKLIENRHAAVSKGLRNPKQPRQ